MVSAGLWPGYLLWQCSWRHFLSWFPFDAFLTVEKAVSSMSLSSFDSEMGKWWRQIIIRYIYMYRIEIQYLIRRILTGKILNCAFFHILSKMQPLWRYKKSVNMNQPFWITPTWPWHLQGWLKWSLFWRKEITATIRRFVIVMTIAVVPMMIRRILKWWEIAKGPFGPNVIGGRYWQKWYSPWSFLLQLQRRFW